MTMMTEAAIGAMVRNDITNSSLLCSTKLNLAAQQLGI